MKSYLPPPLATVVLILGIQFLGRNKNAPPPFVKTGIFWRGGSVVELRARIILQLNYFISK